jgi:hypothetical protein
MPVPRHQVRQNLLQLIQFQMIHRREYGELLLAIWHGIEAEAQDVFLFEVYERFASPEGGGRGTFRFPGIGPLWLPGLYEVTLCSRAEFERATASRDSEMETMRAELASGRAEILWPENPADSPLASALLG